MEIKLFQKEYSTSNSEIEFTVSVNYSDVLIESQKINKLKDRIETTSITFKKEEAIELALSLIKNL